MYNHVFNFCVANDGPCISWESPKTEMLVDFLAFHQHWEPSYIRQRMLPILSTLFLRDMAKNPVNNLLYGQYEFDSIDRLKIRNGHKFYVVKWKRAAPSMNSVAFTTPQEELVMLQDAVIEVDESISGLDESDVPKIHNSDGCYFLLTDENMELVQAAFPEEVDRFLQEKVQVRSLLFQYDASLASFSVFYFSISCPGFVSHIVIVSSMF